MPKYENFIIQTAKDYCMSPSKVQEIYNNGDTNEFYDRLEKELRDNERESEGYNGVSVYNNWYDEKLAKKSQNK